MEPKPIRQCGVSDPQTMRECIYRMHKHIIESENPVGHQERKLQSYEL